MDCPTCRGSGSMGMAHVNTGFNARIGRCDGFLDDNIKCFRCGGTGSVTEEMMQWITDGKALRDKRINAGEPLFQAAARLGVPTSILSAMENGRIKPIF